MEDVMLEYKLGNKTSKNLKSILVSGKEVSRILVKAVKDFIDYTPMDFCIIENGGFRTTEMQRLLFDKGVSKCDGINNKSYHQTGLAVDLVPWINNRPSWNRENCLFLAGAFLSYCKRMKIPITSGADWNGDGNLKDGWDPCHFQIKDI